MRRPSRGDRRLVILGSAGAIVAIMVALAAFEQGQDTGSHLLVVADGLFERANGRQSPLFKITVVVHAAQTPPGPEPAS